MTKTNIACAQIDCRLGDPKTNREKIVATIHAAAERDAQLVIFPECSLTGYAFNSLDEAIPLAEKIDGPSAEIIAEACRETKTYGIVGFIEADGGKFYNAAMLVGPDGVAGSYRKVHLPYIGIDRFLTPGDRPFQIFDLPFGKVGVNICYDISFPEPARVLKLMGAELIASITNWPTAAWRSPQFVANTRALENHVFYAAVDRVGRERGWDFIGRSKVIDCNGDTLAEASADAEELLVVPLELADANNNRIVNVAGAYEVDRVKDRRPQFYEPISEPVSELAQAATSQHD